MTERSRTSKRVILLAIIITSFINPFLGASINIALPAISEDFTMGAVGMSWVSMAFLLSSAVFLVPLGKLADIRGRKRIFFIGNIIIGASSVTLCPFTFRSCSNLASGYSGTGKCHGIWNRHCHYYFCISSQGTG